MKRNEEIEKKKLFDYNIKQLKILEKKKELEKKEKFENEKKLRISIDKENHIKETLLKKEQKENEFKNNILKKISEREENTKKIQEQKYLFNINKAEDSQQHRILQKYKTKTIQKIQENERNKLMQNLQEKDFKLETFIIKKKTNRSTKTNGC